MPTDTHTWENPVAVAEALQGKYLPSFGGKVSASADGAKLSGEVANQPINGLPDFPFMVDFGSGSHLDVEVSLPIPDGEGEPLKFVATLVLEPDTTPEQAAWFIMGVIAGLHATN